MRSDRTSFSTAILGILVSGVTLGGVDAARAQQARIEPAETIRVVERVDRWSRDVEREVVDDLAPAEILSVQVALSDAGYDPGAWDGRLSATTRSALRSFQIDRGLSICGCVSYETVVALGIVPEVVGEAGSYARRGHDRVIVVTPGRSHRRSRRSGAAVVVGAGGRTGVYVGHAPAVGAGRADRVGSRDRRPRPGGEVTRPAPRSRPGGRIRVGDRSRPDGLQRRPRGERPRRPDPR
ncbi:MAG: peptidoglycan-binding domain-containing protein [Gemmatimonadota bacterium]|nr:peptidoglycan-binding domain-containing protein [Gemmatimonadota bacterium]